MCMMCVYFCACVYICACAYACVCVSREVLFIQAPRAFQAVSEVKIAFIIAQKEIM